MDPQLSSPCFPIRVQDQAQSSSPKNAFEPFNTCVLLHLLAPLNTKSVFAAIRHEIPVNHDTSRGIENIILSQVWRTRNPFQISQITSWDDKFETTLAKQQHPEENKNDNDPLTKFHTIYSLLQRKEKTQHGMGRKTNQKAKDLEWLQESSGKFTTYYSRSFLERTHIPLALLRACCCADENDRRMARNTQRLQQDQLTRKKPFVFSRDQVNTFSQSIDPARTSHTLIELIRNERQILRKNRIAAKTLVGWFGPVHWKSSLESLCNGDNNINENTQNENDEHRDHGFDDLVRGIGICPRVSCRMLIVKDGGCTEMQCVCGRRFYWPCARLDVGGVSESCYQVATSHRYRGRRHQAVGTARPQQQKTGSSAAEVVVSELVFRSRLLEAAERAVVKASSPSSGTATSGKRRPSLNLENNDDETILELGIPYHRQRNHPTSDSLPPDTISKEEEDCLCPYPVPVLPANRPPFFNDDESWCSVAATIDQTTGSILGEYVWVSDRDNADVESWEDQSWPTLRHTNDDDNDSRCDYESDESYSFLSGREAVQFLHHDGPGNDAEGAQPTTTLPMLLPSYCDVAKRGIAISVQERPTFTNSRSRTCTTKNPSRKPSSSTQPLLSSIKEVVDNDKNSNTNTDAFVVDFGNDGDIDIHNPLFDSIRDAAKSGHGGKVSFRFKGDPRRDRTSSCWGNHRRPNWTRKRRKAHKNKYCW